MLDRVSDSPSPSARIGKEVRIGPVVGIEGPPTDGVCKVKVK
jgi:hypothetical protein